MWFMFASNVKYVGRFGRFLLRYYIANNLMRMGLWVEANLFMILNNNFDPYSIIIV